MMKLPLPTALDELLYSVYRKVLWTSPRRYRLFAPFSGGGVGRFDAPCDLVVDGFARSGNTFVADMLRATQPAGFRLESHRHIPPFVMTACDRGTPTVLLVRRPVDSVISLSLHSQWSLRKSLDHYIAYHESLRSYRSRVLIARFADFTRDFRQFVLDVNRRFGLSLSAEFDHALLASRTLAAMEGRLTRDGKRVTALQIHRPTRERQQLKVLLLEEIHAPPLRPRLLAAEGLYEEFAEAASSPLVDAPLFHPELGIGSVA